MVAAGFFRSLTQRSPLLLFLAATTTTTTVLQQAHGATFYYTTPTSPYYATSPTGSSSADVGDAVADACELEIDTCSNDATCLTCLVAEGEKAADVEACITALGLDDLETSTATCDEFMAYPCCLAEAETDVDCLQNQLYEDFMFCYMTEFDCPEEITCDATADAEDSAEESLDEESAEEDSTESAGNGAATAAAGAGLGYASTVVAFSSAFRLLLPILMRA